MLTTKNKTAMERIAALEAECAELRALLARIAWQNVETMKLVRVNALNIERLAGFLVFDDLVPGDQPLDVRKAN